MRRLFLVVFVLIILQTTPTLGSVPLQTTDFTALVATEIQEATRVYGTNLASEIYDSCNSVSYRGFVQGLSEIGSRFTRTTENNIAARTWIQEQLTSVSNGRIEVEIVGNQNNVVGLLPGYLPGAHPVFVVSAHLDSAEGSPGANDDASGVALTLELARVMSQYEWPLDIYFVAFNAAVPPQFGLPFQGSNELAQIWENAGLEILALYNVDTILYPYRWAPSDERILLGYADISPYQTSQYWAELAKMIGNMYGQDIIGLMASDTFPIWTQSDHIQFYQEGYRSVVCAHESGYLVDTVSGTAGDVYDDTHFNYLLGRTLTGVIGASIAFSMSRAYGEKTRHFLDGTIYPQTNRTFPIAITAPTQLNVTSRWWGGGAAFTLFNPSSTEVDSLTSTNASAWEFRSVLSTTLAQPGLYHLEIRNIEDVYIGYEVVIEYDTDVDANDVLDKNEYWLDSALFHIDTDLDLLNDAMELIIGTEVDDQDSDSDAMSDGWEHEYGFDPRDPADADDDPDADGVLNSDEFLHGLNPLSSDTDLDSIPDLFEIENGLDPLVNDADLDLDEDGRSNLVEFMEGTNPQIAEENPLLLTLVAIPTSAVLLIGAATYLYRKYSNLM